MDSCDEIVGHWRLEDGRIIADANCRRIEAMLRSELEWLARDSSGWKALYRSRADGRLWELDFPSGEMHGGGPPSLRVISEPEVAARFSLSQAQLEPAPQRE